MKYFLLLFFMLFSCGGFAASTRSIDADQIQSADKTKTFTLPATSGQLLASGSLPVATQINRDSFSGNGSTTAFTLSNTPPSPTTQVQVYVNGILQIYTTDYTISTATLTFVTAPVIGQNIIAIYSRF